MSAAVTTSTEATTPATAPRVPLPESETNRLRSGWVVMVRTAADTPETDRAYYFEELDRSNPGQFKGYTLSSTGSLVDYIGHGLNLSDIMSIEAQDFYAYQRKVRYTGAAGQFSKVSLNRLTDAFMQAAEAKTGKRPVRYSTWVEILSVTPRTAPGDSNLDAEVRVFTNATDTPDSLEYGTMTAENFNLWELDLITPEQFAKSYALASSVWTPDKLYYVNAELAKCTRVAGTVGHFQPLDETTGAHTADETVKVPVERRQTVVFAADSVEAYVASLPATEVLEALTLLSRNTVTRALKHADSNNYCSETAVALTSAGHVLPELTLKGRITIDVDVTTKEYMVLRQLFGAGNGDMSNLQDVVKAQWGRVANNIPGLPANLPEGAKVEIEAGLNWKAPKLRPLA